MSNRNANTIYRVMDISRQRPAFCLVLWLPLLCFCSRRSSPDEVKEPEIPITEGYWTVLYDGFERGDLSVWEKESLEARVVGDLSVSATASFGHHGLEIRVDCSDGVCTTPFLESKVFGFDDATTRISFWILAEELANSSSVRLLYLINAAGEAFFSLRLSDQKEVYLGEHGDQRFPLGSPEEWHKISMEHRPAVQGEDFVDGEVVLSIDEQQVGVFPHQNQDTINRIKFGCIDSVELDESRGSFHIDELWVQVRKVDALWVDAAQTECETRHGRSRDDAYCVISQAARKAGPGTVVSIADGRYPEAFSVVYNGENPLKEYIRFTAESKGVILDGDTDQDGTPDLPGADHLGLISVSRASHVILESFTLLNSTDMGILLSQADHVEILGCLTDHTGSSGIAVWQSNNIVIDGNEVRNAVNAKGAECITVSNTFDFEVKNNLVLLGVGREIGGEGICIRNNSYRGKVFGNHVYDLPGDVGIYAGPHSSGSVSRPDEGLYQIEIHDNHVEDVGVGIALSCENDGYLHHVYIYNNIVNDCEASGIIVSNYITDGGIDGLKEEVYIANNVAFRNGSDPESGYAGIEVRSSSIGEIFLANNICYQNHHAQLKIHQRVYDAGLEDRVFIYNNLLFPFAGAGNEIDPNDPGSCNACIPLDPDFVDAELLDFHLKPGSPAVDAGCSFVEEPGDLGFLLFDMDGQARADGLPDIGADEL